MNLHLYCLRLIVVAGSVLLSATCFAAEPAAPAAPPPQETSRPVRDFPLGVYWPWERTPASARSAGMDTWAFAKQTCELLKENGVDSIWLVNIGVGDLKPLLKITRPLGLNLIPCLSEIEPRNLCGGMGLDPAAADFQAKALEYYALKIPGIVQAVGGDRAGVLAWALCDEPTGVFFDLMEPMRKIFARADPDRPALAVTTWGQTPNLIANTRFTIFCTDLYPFFGPNNPSGPHTPAASRNYYSDKIQRMVNDAGKDGRTGWVMPMCFSDIWGPREMAQDGMETALPGAFVHWRTPTLAEMRWQIWEGLRLGVKGEFFFSLLGETEGNPKAEPPKDPQLQPILTKEATPVGYSALLDRRGHPTPQFTEMSILFRKLAP
ncbi:MAG: hypothetical protein WCQ57_10590, partial [Verrucomicrobiota bacterium]